MEQHRRVQELRSRAEAEGTELPVNEPPQVGIREAVTATLAEEEHKWR